MPLTELDPTGLDRTGARNPFDLLIMHLTGRTKSAQSPTPPPISLPSGIPQINFNLIYLPFLI